MTMDLVSLLGRRLGVLRGPALEWLTRWFALLLDGHPITPDIRSAPGPGLPVGVVFLLHYSIGVVLALLFVLAFPRRHTWKMALGYGALTNVLPWFVMFPAMGFGLL